MVPALANSSPATVNFGLDELKDLPDEVRGKLALLLTFLHTVGRYVLNRDAIWLALDDAKRLCLAAGVPEEHVRAAVAAYWEHSGKVRKTNPMHTSFDDK